MDNKLISIYIKDTIPEADNNQHNFKLYFKERID